MKMLDKKSFLDRIENFPNVVLELGCGNHKKVDGSIGIDALDYDCVDIVGDIYEVLARMPNSSVDAVYSYHFFEHVADLSLLMEELARVLKDGGLLEVVVPHFSNPYFYSDYTHKSFFGLYSFSYFSKDNILKREVPTYGKSIKFDLSNVNLVFKSPRPFYFRYIIKFIVGIVFNLNNYMKEFYEENLCYIFPCYEVKYSLKRIDSQQMDMNER